MNDESREGTAGSNSDDARNTPPLARPAEPISANPNPHPQAILTPGRAFIEILFVMAFLYVPNLVRRFITGGSTIEQAKEYGSYLYLVVIIQGALVLIGIALVLYWDRHPWRTLGLQWKNIQGEIWAAIVALAVIYAVQILISLLIAKVFPQLARELLKNRNEVVNMFPKISPVLLLGFTFFVGLYEELLFRGFLMTRLVKLFKSISWALFLSSLIFAVVHASYQDTLAIFQIFTVAMVLGGLFIIRRSLISPILVHMMFDFISLMAMFYAFKK